MINPANHPNHLITLTTETGPLHVAMHHDGSLVTHTEHKPGARYEDLGELIRHFADIGLDSKPVAEAAWVRIQRRRGERAMAVDCRDELSAAMVAKGLTHSTEVRDGCVLVVLTQAEAEALAAALSKRGGE